MPEEIAAVTREVARARIGRLLETDRRLLQSTVDFWNDLVAEGPDNPGSGSSGARAPASGSDPHPPGERSESDSPPAGTPKTGSG